MVIIYSIIMCIVSYINDSSHSEYEFEVGRHGFREYGNHC